MDKYEIFVKKLEAGYYNVVEMTPEEEAMFDDYIEQKIEEEGCE